ncbi:bifunctional DNA-formamidopyrimidine glycosylase/DNA-(apurinic or apyrimidinic site) lyase [Cohnella cholangitidis]|uniref:Bifunctional DNA-formamidopyrimidine glycosylase/DNA-(Apurinic or apyrimidinic site) lyase n=1 Tax=Cohnella cholangitidis TaxID=2598458 RepID=A0A7G5C5V5_9BACL|nr:bifunctional DNA-formamidopyrimidine glycosylase/DNA-(apurinic or apyrimidinic site) lyase [Cohnella cholangitidis]QMV44589.1 bifunctional DNA-formamidopyrimidine glycosylase/DNA-(apurinic or apyrimidinic site) lyase [Cohnella cholangitidis]
MPELPEMEHYRSQLSELLCGQKITGVTVNREATINESIENFTAGLTDRSILFVERKGKHLLFHLDDGRRLHLHLMLGGWLAFGEQGPKKDSHFQVILTFGNGYSLYFGGLRLGYLHRITAKAAIEELKELGPDPFDSRLTSEAFKKRLAGKKGKLKTTLTDQRFLAGIGNCYSDEICFDAKIHPALSSNELDEAQIEHLYTSMRKVLTEAKEAGGYMEHPLTTSDTVTGGYNAKCRVYDRQEEPCYDCGTEIKLETLTGRKMFYCPVCQPRS